MEITQPNTHRLQPGPVFICRQGEDYYIAADLRVVPGRAHLSLP